MKINLLQGDITKIPVDVIVNAANGSLLGGGGVDGAIHYAAGPQLLNECKQLRNTTLPNGLNTGLVAVTKAYNLPAKFVFHTVGPINGEDNLSLLENCYVNCLNKAEELKLNSISFPAISTGVYRVPLDYSVNTVNKVINDFKPESLQTINLVLFSKRAYSFYLNNINKK